MLRLPRVKCLSQEQSKITRIRVEPRPQNQVGSVVEWLKCQTRDQHGLSSKPTRTILLCLWERHFMAHSPAWWSRQAVLNYSHICTKLQADSNILASLEAGWGNCLPSVLAPPLLSCQEDKYRDKIKIKRPCQ